MINFRVNEYEWRPVPMDFRISFWRLLPIWLSCPMIIFTAMIGAMLALKIGFIETFCAILIGNAFLFLYTVLLGILSMQRGMNLSLQLNVTYGKKSAQWFVLLTSMVTLGWLIVQSGFITESIVSVFNYSPSFIISAVVSALAIVTFFGIRSVSFSCLLSIVLFLLVSVYIIKDVFHALSFSYIWHFKPATPQHFISFPSAVSIVIGSWISGATANSDFNRWARSERSVICSVFTGFPLSSSFAMTVGALVGISLSLSGVKVMDSGNLFYYLIGKNLYWLNIFSVLFIFCNVSSVCIHNLYNATSQMCHLFKISFQPMVIALCACVVLFSLTYAWHHMILIVSIIGIIVPPIGAVIIVDQIFIRSYSLIHRDYRIGANLSWCVGVFFSIYSTYIHPFFVPSLIGVASSGFFYFLWEFIKRKRGFYELYF